MATMTAVLPHHATLCPSPLVIQKKPRRATFRRRIPRKSIHVQQSDQYAFGPLDDIIDEIKSNIWNSPPACNPEGCGFDRAYPPREPSMWTVTPLPVSQIPSNQPLTIHKSRNSRSSASGSSTANAMACYRNNSQDDLINGGLVSIPPSTGTTPWPLFEAVTPSHAPLPLDSSDGTPRTEFSSAQQALENVIQKDGGRIEVTKRRPSRLRLFTNGFPYLRRTGTGEMCSGSGNASEVSSPAISTPKPVSPMIYEDAISGEDIEAATDDALIEAFTRKYARDGNRLASIMGRFARRLPAAVDLHDHPDDHTMAKPTLIRTTLRSAIRVFPQVKLLTQDYEDFDVAVEVEGVLHNRTWLPDTTIDVIFVVDNGYYVTNECLERALDAVNGTFYHMTRGDRVALYTTHCTHHAVSGNRPDLHYPLRPFSKATEEIFRDLTASIKQHGTQMWYPPRPNPSMKEVILSVAKSLEEYDLKNGRTQIILLSPAAYVLHEVSKSFPDLYIHRINPALVPYPRDPEPQDTVCIESCCENVFVSNWTSYQSVPEHIKRILKYARCHKPVGEISDIYIDIRTRNGCEVLDIVGGRDIPHLRLGQVHTFFCRIRVTRNECSDVDLGSSNPIFNSSLDVKELRQELLNANAKGAIKVHLFDVQMYHRNSLHSTDCWNYSETPLLVIRQLGDLAPPVDGSFEVHRRLCFYHAIRMKANAGEIETKNFLTHLGQYNEQTKKVVKCMAKEIGHYQETLDYEKNYRQKLPLCPGPVVIEASPHEWLLDLWDRKRTKRNGVTIAKEENVSDLLDSINRPEQLD